VDRHSKEGCRVMAYFLKYGLVGFASQG